MDCLSGSFRGDVDWHALIKLANESLMIAHLAAAMQGVPATAGIPDDVRAFLDEVFERNLQRNTRMKAQLEEAVKCLNGVGIEPAVMKGAAILLSSTPAFSRRILIDLDILVRPADMPAALAALQGNGYEVRIGAATASWPGDPDALLPIVLARPSDVGSIDLQCRLKGPASFSDIGWFYANSTPHDLSGGTVYVPSTTAQAIYLLLHDQFQDGDYWRGLIDLRHLYDIAALVESSGPIDTGYIRSLFSKGYESNAVDTQLMTLAALFPALKIDCSLAGPLARAQLRRRRLQISWRRLMPMLTIVSMLSEARYYGSWDRFGGPPQGSLRGGAKHRLRELRRNFRPVALGKV